jgi:NAD(P)-dependent dehydrogenase (short-subunit alcohol dehydrogenase family)
MILKNKHAIITGAGQGLGSAIAEHFVREGASILICDRSNKIELVKSKLSKFITDNQFIDTITCDISLISDVDKLFKRAREIFPSLEILVNNAAVHGPLGKLSDIDWDEWVKAININLIGTVYCCKKALELFKKNNYGKIINLSGGGATKPLPGVSAYATSKAGIIRFTETLSEEVKEIRVDVNAVAPGALKTNITKDFFEAGPKKIGQKLFDEMIKVRNGGGTPLSIGARCCVYLASEKSDGLSGKLIAAQWDPWEKFENYKNELNTTDIYSLRRIAPEDRGLKWDN